MPADWLVPCRADNVLTNAIVYPEAAYGGPILVVMTDVGRRGVYLGGTSAFEMVTDDGIEDFAGVAIEGVEFELSLEGAEYYGFSAAPLGSLVRAGDQLKMMVSKGKIIQSNVYINIASGLPSYTSLERTAFPNWRIVKLTGEDKITLWETSQKSLDC